jgi:protein-disulfide isomerase
MPAEDFSRLVIPVTATDHARGPDHAPVTVVEYGDFQCPICAGAEPGLRQLRENHPQTVRLVYRHFPLEDVHPHARLAAEAAEAAGAQGRFWPMHAMLFANQRHLDRPHLEAYAERIGLDTARFSADLTDELYLQRVREHQRGARQSHVRSSPAFFVNGRLCDTSGGLHRLLEAVQQLLTVH